MQTNEFLNYLNDVVTPERKLVFQGAIETLIAAGNRDVEYYIDQTTQQEDLGETNDFLDEIEQLLAGALFGVISNFGVTLEPGTPMVIATDVLRGLRALGNWGEPGAIAAVCEQNESPEAILADLLALVGRFHSVEFLPHLTRVSEALIERIDALNPDLDPGVLPSEEERRRAVDRTRRYMEKATAPILSLALSEMLLIGGGYQAMMEPYHDRISELTLPGAVNELVGFALASELTNDALEAAILTECQGWANDHPGAATQADALVKARLKEVFP